MANQRARIVMSADEVAAFLDEQRRVTLCTMHPSGSIHAVAMWYAVLDGAVTFETKAKSQKVQNLRRDPRMTCLFEAGERYEELRGVELVGRAEVIEGPHERILHFGRHLWERYVGAFDAGAEPQVERMMRKRVLIRLHVERTVSWDHRKLVAD